MAPKNQVLRGGEEDKLSRTHKRTEDKMYGTVTVGNDEESNVTLGCTKSHGTNGFSKELVEVMSLSWPAILTISGLLFCAGLTSACDTLFSQAYGGKRLQSIGVNLQKSVLIVSLACVLCWSLHLNAERLFVLLGQDEGVSRLAASYILCFMPGLIFNFLYQVALKFLQNQGLLLVTAFLGLGGNIFNAGVHYILLYACSQGLKGSALGQALTWFVMCLAAWAYIMFSVNLDSSRAGWSWLALADWGQFLKLGAAGYAVLLTDWCAFDMAILIAGYLGVVEQGAVSAALHLEMFGYMICRGLGTACCIRVGQNLGAGDGDGAKTSYRVSAIFTGTVMFAIGLTILCLKDVLPWLFTADLTTADLVSRSIPLMLAVMLADSVLCLHADAFTGCGKQSIGAIIQTCGYCLISTPAVVILMLHTPAAVLGCWWALLLGIVPMAVVYIIIVNRLDWQRLADEVNVTTNDTGGYTSEGLINDPCVPYNRITESDKLCKANGETNSSGATKTQKTPDFTALITKRIYASIAVFGVFFLSLSLRIFAPV